MLNGRKRRPGLHNEMNGYPNRSNHWRFFRPGPNWYVIHPLPSRVSHPTSDRSLTPAPTKQRSSLRRYKMLSGSDKATIEEQNLWAHKCLDKTQRLISISKQNHTIATVSAQVLAWQIVRNPKVVEFSERQANPITARKTIHEIAVKKMVATVKFDPARRTWFLN